MKEQNIKPSQLDAVKRNELKGYVEKILAYRQNSSSSKVAVDSSVPLHLKLRSKLPGTKWRMAFTTQTLMAEALPNDATITLTFAESTNNNDNKVEYGLDFFKTLALKRLVAQSTYTVMDVSLTNLVFYFILLIIFSSAFRLHSLNTCPNIASNMSLTL